MHVMIATDGTLDAGQVAAMAAPLAAGGTVTVFTVVEVPRTLLADIRAAAGNGGDGGDPEFRRTQADTPSPSSWLGDDTLVEQYVSRTVTTRTDAVAAALREHGVDPEVIGVEGESAAQAVLAAVRDRGIDVLCIGPHGLGRFEGLLGSISTKLVRRADCSVLVVR